MDNFSKTDQYNADAQKIKQLIWIGFCFGLRISMSKLIFNPDCSLEISLNFQ